MEQFTIDECVRVSKKLAEKYDAEIGAATKKVDFLDRSIYSMNG